MRTDPTDPHQTGERPRRPSQPRVWRLGWTSACCPDPTFDALSATCPTPLESRTLPKAASERSKPTAPFLYQRTAARVRVVCVLLRLGIEPRFQPPEPGTSWGHPGCFSIIGRIAKVRWNQRKRSQERDFGRRKGIGRAQSVRWSAECRVGTRALQPLEGAAHAMRPRSREWRVGGSTADEWWRKL